MAIRKTRVKRDGPKEPGRSKMKAAGIGLLVAFISILALISCAGCTARAESTLASEPSPRKTAVSPDPSKTFTLRINGEPETLDWNKAHTPIETYILTNIMDGLV